MSVPRCMVCGRLLVQNVAVTSREGRVSRNDDNPLYGDDKIVTSREGRVSRNETAIGEANTEEVTSREGRVSRNADGWIHRQSGGQSRPARDV